MVQLLDKIKSCPFPQEIEILIVDNGSESGSYIDAEELASTIAGVRFKRFENDLGFGRNFLRLLSEVNSQYVITLSDEDHITADGLEDILRVLKRKNPTLLVLRDPQFSLFPTSTLKTSKLRGATNYVSGITFNIDLVRRFLWPLDHLAQVEHFAELYPQVLLALLSTTERPGLVYSRYKLHHLSSLPSTILARSGEPYWHPSERVRQQVSLVRCLEELETLVGFRQAKSLKKFLAISKRNFFGSVFDGVILMYPESSRYFALYSFKTVLAFYLRTLLRFWRALPSFF